jgi:hypothetical protein
MNDSNSALYTLQKRARVDLVQLVFGILNAFK